MNNQNYQNNGNNNMNGNQPPNGNGNQNKKGGNGPEAPKGQSVMVLLIASLIVLVTVSYFMKTMDGGASKEITYDAV